MDKHEIYIKYLEKKIEGDIILNENEFFKASICNFDITENDKTLVNNLYYIVYLYRNNLLIPFIF